MSGGSGKLKIFVFIHQLFYFLAPEKEIVGRWSRTSSPPKLIPSMMERKYPKWRISRWEINPFKIQTYTCVFFFLFEKSWLQQDFPIQTKRQWGTNITERQLIPTFLWLNGPQKDSWMEAKEDVFPLFVLRCSNPSFRVLLWSSLGSLSVLSPLKHGLGSIFNGTRSRSRSSFGIG